MIRAMTLNPAREHDRLRQLYRGMTEEELSRLAGQAASLTDVARLVLQEEIAQRGLAIALKEHFGEDILEKRNLISIRRFRDLPQALLAKGSLESAGIECFLADDNMVRMDWFISNLLGGIKLLVNADDAEEAVAVLAQPIPESFEVQGLGDYQQPHCPECKSLDVSFDELNKKIAYPSAWIGLPLPIHNRAWSCHACGNRWQPSEAGESIPTEER
jgi:Putative prokaryotic signal transducing protein